MGSVPGGTVQGWLRATAGLPWSLPRALGVGTPGEGEAAPLARAARAQRRSFDVLADYLRPERFSTGALGALGRELLPPADPRRALRFFLPGPGLSAAWQEELNKAEVYLLVSQIGLLVGLDEDADPPPLEVLLERAYELGPFPALWALEGVGNEVAAALLRRRGALPDGLLRRPDGLPSASLLMLHAGLGLAVARHVLGALRGTDPGAAAVERAVADVVATCRRAGRPGYVGAALESLGLVTRTFYPWLVPAVGEAAAKRQAENGDRRLEDFFWHGVGRALYFVPARFLPCGETTWRAFREAAAAPAGAPRHNAVAGLAWALTLVNQRHPAVVEDLLRRHGGALAELEGFANGVASSVVMRRVTTPDAPFDTRLCGHRPAPPVAGWQELVDRPCRLGLEVIYPGLEHDGVALDEVFLYHPLEELVHELEGTP